MKKKSIGKDNRGRMRGLGGGIYRTVVKNIGPLLKKSKCLQEEKMEMGMKIEELKQEMKNVHASLAMMNAFLLSSQNSEHDEIDNEFLGNRTGQPYIVQTNVFTGGKGDREQWIYLWFDPTKDYHSYSVLWNLYKIM